jgi:hypothetical protein
VFAPKLSAVLLARYWTLPTGMLVYEIVAVAGDGMRRWARDLITTVHQHAARMGCRRIHAIGRTGFARLAKAYGYASDHVFLEKDL